MRIVDRKTFLGMPNGTMFAKYEPCVFGPLEIKCDTYGSDFVSQQIINAIDGHDSGEVMDMLDASEETGCSIPMNFDCAGRDGCFDEDQLFAVLETADVDKLIERIKQG